MAVEVGESVSTERPDDDVAARERSKTNQSQSILMEPSIDLSRCRSSPVVACTRKRVTAGNLDEAADSIRVASKLG